MTIVQERLAQLSELHLLEGAHKSFEEGACAMELVSWVAGEKWSDAPKCACPVISAFMRNWNDSLRSDDERDRLLKPLIPKLVGTKSTKQIESRRAFMALDWLIRVHTPAWLDCVESLKPHALALRSLEEIADTAGLVAAGKLLKPARADASAAWDAARAAAWDAARAAAGAAAWAAAGAAARDAARAAAWDAAWDAARDAARAAAGAAAGAAAWDAAWAAAGDALKPTTGWLQTSAVNLVERMCALEAK